jgi:hypothetical protein
MPHFCIQTWLKSEISMACVLHAFSMIANFFQTPPKFLSKTSVPISLTAHDDLPPFASAFTSKRQMGQAGITMAILLQPGEVQTADVLAVLAQGINLATVL